MLLWGYIQQALRIHTVRPELCNFIEKCISIMSTASEIQVYVHPICSAQFFREKAATTTTAPPVCALIYF